MVNFTDELHEQRFNECMAALPDVFQKNREYYSLMYLLSSDISITSNMSDVFDFNNRLIFPDSFANHDWQTSSSLRTVKLAYNLFNGNTSNGYGEDSPFFTDRETSVANIFDYGNLDLYMEAIKIRYNGIEI